MKNSQKTLAGIDLSLTSPAICIHKGSKFSIDNCTFYFLTNSKKLDRSFGNIHGLKIPEYSSNEHRYDLISEWILRKIIYHEVQAVCLEDYAYAATGRVFHIAENGGVVKYRLWCNQIPLVCIPPTQIKKFATSKGNANKEAMQVAFFEETGYNIKEELDLTEKQWNPSSDIIDSYFICKYGFELLGKQNDEKTDQLQNQT